MTSTNGKKFIDTKPFIDQMREHGVLDNRGAIANIRKTLDYYIKHPDGQQQEETEPKTYFNSGLCIEAIRSVFDGLSSEEALIAAAKKFGLDQSEIEDGKRNYIFKNQKNIILDTFNNEIRKLTRSGYTKKVYLKQSTKLTQILSKIEMAVSIKEKVRKLEESKDSLQREVKKLKLEIITTGECPPDSRYEKVKKLKLAGLPNKDIAKRLGISESTVKRDLQKRSK